MMPVLENGKTKITTEVVAAIKGMYLRGDQQFHIGCYFSLNSGRVNECIHGKGSGRKYKNVQPMDPMKLPPPGPYVLVVRADMDAVTAKALAHAHLIDRLEKMLAELRDPVALASN
jgi:hypothetical protein